MPFRTSAETKLSINGRPYTVSIIDNPTIDDVMVTEMKVYAAEVIEGTRAERRVDRGVRDILIRLGVER